MTVDSSDRGAGATLRWNRTEKLSKIRQIPTAFRNMNLPDPAQVIGQEIVEVRGRCEANAIDGWLDFSRTYFRLSNGNWITTGWLELSSSPPSEEFQPVAGPWCSLILGRKIRDVLTSFEGGIPDDSWVMLQLSDGTRVRETSIAPHGTGMAGVHVTSEEEFRAERQAEVRSIWNRAEDVRP